MQETRQPVTHENIDPVPRGVAATAHEFVETAAARLTTLRFRLQPHGVAGGEFDAEKPRDFGADGFSDEPRHELRVAFQAEAEGGAKSRPPIRPGLVRGDARDAAFRPPQCSMAGTGRNVPTRFGWRIVKRREREWPLDKAQGLLGEALAARRVRHGFKEDCSA